ncbi:recombinase family protein [Candidatus Venteria ishoeyi]|uniref:Uncharacterized protein n=1 Tax=Candidatus Venteria ishoeyi TaxID=1899563 RepID=A0A1H6F9U7_9GAMM|nr:recombinase family protein [Candidatus Venteria ishoeyi]SEH06867.1 Uncharacterised protein [Candidatus Venteria ishoeyi]
MDLQLKDIVSTEQTIQTQKRGKAIRLDDGLAGQSEALVSYFTPTQSALKVLKNIQKSVLPNASPQQRAMIWHGIYGAGKSHLGVLVGHLLRHGTDTNAFKGLLKKLENLDQPTLARELANTFPALEDSGARPYLVVPLYGSQNAPSLQLALLEALYDSVSRASGLDEKLIIPKTEYDAAVTRFEDILDHKPELQDASLDKWGLMQEFLTADNLLTGLKKRTPEALETFKAWHVKVSAGAAFRSADAGGKNVTEAYFEACQNLAKQHGYAGIAILWDELGYALENLLTKRPYNAVNEVFALQNFIETLCGKKDNGHLLFMGLTHRDLGNYGVDSGAEQTVIQRLRTIEGRFGNFHIELKATEQEGYHLLGGLREFTSRGEAYLNAADENLEALTGICSKLAIFNNFEPQELMHVARLCYPLHPVTAAALFGIASRGSYSEASRTIFTFYTELDKETQGKVFNQQVDIQRLYGAELIRLPALLMVYEQSIAQELPALVDMYHNAVAKIKAQADAVERRVAVLTVMLLARVLGDNFQPTEKFLAITLYDATVDSVEAAYLQEDLDWLKQAQFIYKNDRTGVWELESGGNVEVGGLIEEQAQQVDAGMGTHTLLNNHVDMCADLFPHLGIHDLDPSPAGIVRAYAVHLLDTPFESQSLKLDNECLSAQVFLVLPKDERAAEKARISCRQAIVKNDRLLYFWIPRQGTRNLDAHLRRYVAIERLLQQAGTGDSMRRRLLMEWENNRYALIKLLREYFGGKGLEDGQAQIFAAGDIDNPLSCRSWHEFRDLVGTQVNLLYPKEVPVRAMNVNHLYVEKARKIPKLEHLLHHILHFDEDVAEKDRNDLLGEKETSERAATIDGTLGKFANDLFIQGADVWDIKTLEQVDEPIKSVLQLMRDELVYKRKKAYPVSELRKTLLNPPYGIPSAAMPLFAAVALRADYKRLKWVNGKGAFHQNLASAFNEGTKAQIRHEDFNRKQLNLLRALAKALECEWVIQDEHQAARETLQALRKHIEALPDAVKYTAKLSRQAQDFVREITQPGRSSHELVDFLLLLNGVNEALRDGLEIDGYSEVTRLLRNLLGEFDEIANARQKEIQNVLYAFLDNKEKLIAGLQAGNQNCIANALSAEKASQMVAPLVQCLANKSLAECSDMETGRLSAKLENVLNTALTPLPPVSSPPTVTGTTNKPVNTLPLGTVKPAENTPARVVMVDDILVRFRQVIDHYKNKADKQTLLQAVDALRTELQ